MLGFDIFHLSVIFCHVLQQALIRIKNYHECSCLSDKIYIIINSFSRLRNVYSSLSHVHVDRVCTVCFCLYICGIYCLLHHKIRNTDLVTCDRRRCCLYLLTKSQLVPSYQSGFVLFAWGS
jgi:hypothetical protein